MPSLPNVLYLPETADHDLVVDAIAADAFGPGRFARAAERVREMAPYDRRLCLVAVLEDEVIGSVRQTPVAVGSRPAVMLGPLAVRPAFKGHGIGRTLMGLAAEAARRAGESAVVLVGDRDYYEPLGYRPLPPGSVVLPGPVDLNRILGLALAPDALEGLAGVVRPRGVLAQAAPRDEP